MHPRLDLIILCAVPIFPSSIVDQVGQFNNILAPRPVGAEWNAANSLFAFWIGINDVVRSILGKVFDFLLFADPDCP